jgi:hypothetical protein
MFLAGDMLNMDDVDIMSRRTVSMACGQFKRILSVSRRLLLSERGVFRRLVITALL